VFVPFFPGFDEIRLLLKPLGVTPTGLIITSMSDLLKVAMTKFGVAPFFELTFHPLVGSENKQTFGLRVSFLNTFLY